MKTSMKKTLIFLCVLLMVCTVVYAADQIIRYDEAMVGAGHPSLADTLNRALLIQHNDNGETRLKNNLGYQVNVVVNWN
jgi:hypothetical protein